VVVWLALALTPIALVADYVFGVTGTPSCLLSAGALAPLAFVIGEATENVAEHTGAGIGGFLNASFGNAPELIISRSSRSAGACRTSCAARSPARSSRRRCSCSAAR